MFSYTVLLLNSAAAPGRLLWSSRDWKPLWCVSTPLRMSNTTEIRVISKLGGKQWGVSVTRKSIKFGGSTEKPLLRTHFGCEAMTWYVGILIFIPHMCESLAASLVLPGPKKDPSLSRFSFPCVPLSPHTALSSSTQANMGAHVLRALNICCPSFPERSADPLL